MTNLSKNAKWATLPLLFAFLFFYIKCQNDPKISSNLETEAPDPLVAKVREYTLCIGTQLIANCSSNARKKARLYDSWRIVQGNRLEITMHVTWEGGTSGCNYRIDGVLTINQDGSDPDFRKTDDNIEGGIFCAFPPGCARRFNPAPCQ